MNQVLIDRVASLTLHGGLVRIECHCIAADGKDQPSGTLLIPGNVAGPIIQSLVNSLQELEKKIREAQVQAGSAGNA